MRGPKPTPIELSHRQSLLLQKIVRRATSPQYQVSDAISSGRSRSIALRSARRNSVSARREASVSKFWAAEVEV